MGCDLLIKLAFEVRKTSIKIWKEQVVGKNGGLKQGVFGNYVFFLICVLKLKAISNFTEDNKHISIKK